VEIVVTVVVAIGLALAIQAFVVKPYKIPSGSMIPSLSVGQRILVNRLGTHPGIGEIVVFHPPVGAEGDGVCGNPSQGAEAAAPEQACDQAIPQEWTSETSTARPRSSPTAPSRLKRRSVMSPVPRAPATPNAICPRRSSFPPGTTT
jgi:hypothetical protein